MIEKGTYVRSLVERNNVLNGYIGVCFSNKEPYIVLFSIDGKDYFERYLADEIEKVEMLELSYDELNDFLELKSPLLDNYETPYLVESKDKAPILNLNHIKNVLELVDDNSMSLEQLSCWFYTIYYSKTGFDIDFETENLIKEFMEDIDTFFSSDKYQYFTDISTPILERIYNLHYDVNERLVNIVLTKKELKRALYKIVYEGYNEDERDDIDTLLDKLSKSDPVNAYVLRGFLYLYGIYGYKNDIDEATKWFSKAYEITGDSEATAYLGEIALLNKEYDNAFKYLSHSAQLGFYKGKYLLSDMYLNGNGILATPEISAKLLMDSIDELKSSFERGGYSGYFGEFSERIGNLFYNGYFYKQDFDAALIAYLEARYAYYKRYKLSGYYYDKDNIKRIDNIIKDINDIKGYNRDKMTNVSIIYYTYIERLGANHKINVSYEGNFIHLKIKGNMALITEPISNYCKITDTIHLTFEFASIDKRVKSMTVDQMDFSDFGSIVFKRNNKVINCLKFDEAYFNGGK